MAGIAGRALAAGVLAILVGMFAACGGNQEGVEATGETGGATTEVTGGTTAGTTAGGTTGGTTAGTTVAGPAQDDFQGIVDSYAIAQEEISSEGGLKEVGPYLVGYIVEPAEGWWEGEPNRLRWREPEAGETNHIEVLPFDPDTGLLIPEMSITLTVLDESGREVESKELEFYYGEFYHYANNFSLPESGTYTLKVDLEPPRFNRHGSEDGEGKVFTQAATVEFEGVEIEAGEE
ncbi:hypothetical protein E0L93_12245 [Rubrobacter taiwanensis]|uniref:Uncharacterized protein n=1 Tax=Rubrobacter taiwanensis TaxID=185139 RepID=A0A4R1BEP0_9ACTN|nr:iron transporter [Rubrobacter taiwanensis]TCJ15591.1 hypothetical protein E0L93_12245 [Rubrobacter taiwanensis]